MKRLLSYLKPHKFVMTAATVLVLFIIVVELYRPIIIGDAIDNFINGYYRPYVLANEDDREVITWNGLDLTRKTDEELTLLPESTECYQIFLYHDSYYMAESITPSECTRLRDADNEYLENYVQNGAPLLGREELKELRTYDFVGILRAALLYLLMLLIGFILNYMDTWMLQKMGQKIVYQMREEVFTHIHSLSLTFFNSTPVGKLVTRVSNDTEAINELFSSILVKLFKNTVKIVGYAVVMLSIDVRMAGLSFLLLPVVTFLTFLFQILSRKAYQITRTKITDLNTFLSEHISGMRLIQIFAREEAKYKQFKGKSQELFEANWREVMIFAIFRPAIYLTSILAMVIVIGGGSYWVLQGTLSLGTLFIFISYISSFFEPIQDLAEQFGTLRAGDLVSFP